MFGLFRRKPHERIGFALYTSSVRAARQPWFYTTLGVPDTLDGRFDMVGLHVVILLDRLQALPAPGAEIGQAVFDAMFADMDQTIREFGVTDMGVGRRVKQMWEALHGRSAAYLPAMGDDAALMAALARNVWRGEAPADGPGPLASYARRQHAVLATRTPEAFRTGEAGFVPMMEQAA